jgi:hypothetical protein
VLMFVDSLFYGLMFVDDGYCEGLSGEGVEACESLPSKMQSGVSYCSFDHETGECSLRPPPADIIFFLTVSMIVTIFSIIPSVFCKYILESICARTPSFAHEGLSESKYIMNLGELRRSAKDTLTSYMIFSGRSDEEAVKQVVDSLSTEFAQNNLTSHVTTVDSTSFGSRMRDLNSYMDTCSLEEEVDQISASARAFIHYNLASRAMPWEVQALTQDDGVHRAEALKHIIGVYDDGSPVPLTMLQKVMYGTARKRLEWKVRKVRRQVAHMETDIEVFLRSDQGCVDHINSYLIQSFMLEQLSPFRRYAIRREFFQYDDANPCPIAVLPWISAWAFLITALLFLAYWILIWAVQNSRATAFTWALQLSFVLLQECFVNEVLQVLIMNVVVVETLRPQIKRIVDVLTSILVSKVSNLDKRSVDNSSGQPQVENGFNVAQHMSAACRVARKPILNNLVASKILLQLDDHDIAMCRESRLTHINFLTKMLISIPTALALSHESIQECFLDVAIPTLWCCFVLANAMLFALSPFLMVAPYIIVLLAVLARYCYYLPLKRRRRAIDQELANQHKAASKVSPASGYNDHRDSEENMWRNMNLSLTLIDKSQTIVPDKFIQRSVSAVSAISVMSDDFFESPLNLRKTIQSQFSFDHQMSFTQSDIPPEIASQRVQLSRKDKYFYDKSSKWKNKSFESIVNDRLWKTSPVLQSSSLLTRNHGSKSFRHHGDEWSSVFSGAGLALSAVDSDGYDEQSRPSSPVSPLESTPISLGLERPTPETEDTSFVFRVAPLQTTRSLSTLNATSFPAAPFPSKPLPVPLNKLLGNSNCLHATSKLKTERAICKDDMDLRLVAMSTRYLKRKQESAGTRLDQCDTSL